MTDRVKFNKLKIEVLGLVGIMEAMEVANSKQLEAEFRRFTNIVTHTLPTVRKESIDVYRTDNELITQDSTIK